MIYIRQLETEGLVIKGEVWLLIGGIEQKRKRETIPFNVALLILFFNGKKTYKYGEIMITIDSLGWLQHARQLLTNVRWKYTICVICSLDQSKRNRVLHLMDRN